MRTVNIGALSSAVQIDPSLSAPADADAAAVPLQQAPVRTRWWVELFTIAWLLWVYDAITNLAPLRLAAALDHARGIENLEHTLGSRPSARLTAGLRPTRRSA